MAGIGWGISVNSRGAWRIALSDTGASSKRVALGADLDGRMVRPQTDCAEEREKPLRWCGLSRLCGALWRISAGTVVCAGLPLRLLVVVVGVELEDV